MSPKHLILIGGPTAAGKSAFAMEIARRRNGSIINADAMQIYAGLPVLTAQPEAKDRAEIPHYLYEVTDPAEASSAGKWVVQARDAIAEVRAAGRVPIVVGGTGLYFRALLGGLADIPEVPSGMREEAERLYNEKGEEKFRADLEARDPGGTARIAPNDRQRLIRAWEVLAHTGRGLRAWQAAGASPAPEDEDIERHLLLPPRDELYARCDQRFLSMIERGAVEEVKRLMARELSPALSAMKILGVREIAAFLRGETIWDTAVAKAQQMTRNYAKRQMTWFRNSW